MSIHVAIIASSLDCAFNCSELQLPRFRESGQACLVSVFSAGGAERLCQGAKRGDRQYINIYI